MEGSGGTLYFLYHAMFSYSQETNDRRGEGEMETGRRRKGARQRKRERTIRIGKRRPEDRILIVKQVR